MQNLRWLLVFLVGASLVHAEPDEDGYERLPTPPPGTKRVFLGFKLTRIDPGSIYEKVGLREGDLIRSINGNPVISPADLKELPRILDRDRKVELKVDRGEKKLTLRYTIKTVQTAAPPLNSVAKKRPQKAAQKPAKKTTKPVAKASAKAARKGLASKSSPKPIKKGKPVKKMKRKNGKLASLDAVDEASEPAAPDAGNQE